MSKILDKIVAQTKQDLIGRKEQCSEVELTVAARNAPPARDFHAALSGDGVRLIAECKKQSPSRGVMVEDYDPVKLATAYEAGGAAAISVLTDEPFFGGRLDHLSQVRSQVQLPVLRKDFIVDSYQIYEARAAGADTFLLLASVLPQEDLTRFLSIGRELGMEALVESHTAAELETAIASGAKILGINNRDLNTFEVSLDHARDQLAGIMAHAGLIPVCESGIKSAKDVQNMVSIGYSAFLVGETVATAADPQAMVEKLVSN